MTKDELRTQYVNAGWGVQPVAEWTFVSSVDGKVKYDLNVVSPSNEFFTAQVIVTDDNGSSENAAPFGQLEIDAPSYEALLVAWLLTQESGNVFAISIQELDAFTETAVVNVYIGTDTVTKKRYVVRYRNDTFEFKEII